MRKKAMRTIKAKIINCCKTPARRGEPSLKRLEIFPLSLLLLPLLLLSPLLLSVIL